MTLLTEPTRIVLAKGQPVPNDPYLYTNTVLLLHGDGTNGSTTIVDSSKVAGSPKTVTAFGNAQISTAQSKFGGASILFDGTGDRLTVPDSNDFEFGSGNFTIESWVRLTSGGNNKVVFAKSNRNDSGGIGSFALNITPTNTVVILASSSVGPTGSLWQVEQTSTTALSLNTWHHLAFVRNGNVFSLYIDGISSASTTQAITLVNNAEVLTIGTLGYTSGTFVNDFPGYIDDLRITKGIARYTSNFTPPTAPFPDF